MTAFTRIPNWMQGLGIVLLTLVAYLPAMLHGGWIWDDPEYILRNSLISNRVSDLADIWFSLKTPQYYPLVFTSFWIEHNLWGVAADGSQAPFGYHVVNVLLHACNGVLVWQLFLRLRVRWAWLIGAVFALHPMLVESAAWVTERKNTLSGFFYLLSALAYLRFDDVFEKESKRTLADWKWYAVAFVCFVGALLSKTVTASLPPALVLALLFQRKVISVRRLLPLLPMLVTGVGMGLLTAWIEKRLVGMEAFSSEQAMPWAERIIVYSKVLWFYPTKLLLPWPLIFNYPRWIIDTGRIADWLPVVAAVGLGGFLIWLWRRGMRGPFLALSFFAGTIFPAGGIVYVFPHKFSFVADHFCYLGSLGVIALFVACLARAVASIRGAALLGSTVLAACGVLTWLQCGDYRSEDYLWHSTISRNPASWMGHNNLSVIYLDDGEEVLNNGLPKSAQPWFELSAFHGEQAVALKSNHYKAHMNLGTALFRLGRFGEALQHFETSVKLMREGYTDAPEKLRMLAPMALIYGQMGQCHSALNQPTAALDSYEKALQVDGRDFLTLLHQGEELLRLGRDEAAVQCFLAIQRVLPPPGVRLSPTGLLPPATDAHTVAILDGFQMAFSVVPSLFNGAASVRNQARVRVALFLTLPPADQFKDLHLAEELLSGVTDAQGAQSPEVLHARALVAAEAGLWRSAVNFLKQAQQSITTNDSLRAALQKALTECEEKSGSRR